METTSPGEMWLDAQGQGPISNCGAMLHHSLGIRRPDVFLDALFTLLHGRFIDFVYSQADWAHLVMTRRTGPCHGLSYDVRERLDAILHECKTLQDAEEDSMIEMTLHAVVYDIRANGPLSRSDCPLVLLTPYEDMALGTPMPMAVLDVLLCQWTFYELVGPQSVKRWTQLCRTGPIRGRSRLVHDQLLKIEQDLEAQILAMEAQERLMETVDTMTRMCSSCGTRPALEYIAECGECYDAH